MGAQQKNEQRGLARREWQGDETLMFLTTTYMGTPLYEMAVELAEQFTDDFDAQEEFIEGVIRAYLLVSGEDG